MLREGQIKRIGEDGWSVQRQGPNLRFIDEEGDYLFVVPATTPDKFLLDFLRVYRGARASGLAVGEAMGRDHVARAIRKLIGAAAEDGQ